MNRETTILLVLIFSVSTTIRESKDNTNTAFVNMLI